MHDNHKDLSKNVEIIVTINTMVKIILKVNLILNYFRLKVNNITKQMPQLFPER